MSASASKAGPSVSSIDWTKRLKTPEDVLDFIAANRDKVSLSAYSVGDLAGGIHHRADAPHPLASSVKTLVLYEYARQVAAGQLSADERVPLADVEAYYLPTSDGGAHPAAVKELRARGQLDDHGRVTLANIARVMIKLSDNAATDYLIERLGREHLAGAATRLNLVWMEAPFPLSGAFVLWLDKAIPRDRQVLSDRAYAVADRLRRDPAYREQVRERWNTVIPTLKNADFLKLAAADNRGTTRGYAGLLSQVYQTSPGIPASISRQMRAALEWPMESPDNQQFFDVLGTKGGSLPGTLTSGMYVKAKQQPTTRVVSLFFKDLPMPIYTHMAQTFVQQSFEFRLALDDAFFQKVRSRLVEGTTGGQ